MYSFNQYIYLAFIDLKTPALIRGSGHMRRRREIVFTLWLVFIGSTSSYPQLWKKGLYYQWVNWNWKELCRCVGNCSTMLYKTFKQSHQRRWCKSNFWKHKGKFYLASTKITYYCGSTCLIHGLHTVCSSLNNLLDL